MSKRVLAIILLLCFVKISEAARTGPVFFTIEPQYQTAKDFHEGLAAVKREDRWGYIDYLGHIVIPFVHRIPEAGDWGSLYRYRRLGCFHSN